MRKERTGFKKLALLTCSFLVMVQYPVSAMVQDNSMTVQGCPLMVQLHAAESECSKRKANGVVMRDSICYGGGSKSSKPYDEIFPKQLVRFQKLGGLLPLL